MTAPASSLAIPTTVSSVPKRSRSWNPPSPSPALMAVLGVVNRFTLLRSYFRVRELVIPAHELALLRSAVNPETSAFLGPNHPEFGCDWMIDKEISTYCAPRMASWADRGIVAIAPRFWGMNNLVANDGGDAAREYSIESALRGDHVLLHPEGTVRWTANHVHPLFPGIAQMAIAAAERTDRPVFMVPLVWKLRYTGDVSRALHREMKLIEDALGVRRGSEESVGDRFAELQESVMAMRMHRFGYEPIGDGDFFTRQSVFQRHLLDVLASRHDAGESGDTDRRIVRMMKLIRARLGELRGADSPSAVAERAQLKQDLEYAEEAKRAGELSRECYGTPTLTQEQVGESLKRMRDRLLNQERSHKIANMLPRPYGSRVAHVGVPEPIRVQRVVADDRARYERELLAQMRARMQEKLDQINASIEPDVRAWRVVNGLTV